LTSKIDVLEEYTGKVASSDSAIKVELRESKIARDAY
jgi:hypothetical protein